MSIHVFYILKTFLLRNVNIMFIMILGREFGGIMATFGERLKDLRTKKHLTQSQLADALGVSKQAISQYENGIRTPKDYEQIADFFNVNLDYLLGRENKSVYYLDPETAEAAQQMHDNQELKVLFDAARTASPEDLRTTYQMLMALKRKEHGSDD